MPFFDLEHRLRTDPNYANQVQRASAAFSKAVNRARSDPAARPAVSPHALNFMRVCNYNPILLSRYYFPISFGGNPLSFRRYPLAYYLMAFQPELDITVMGSRQISKSVSLCCRQTLIPHLLHNFSSIYIVPHPDQLKTYARNLDKMYNSFRYKMRTSKYGEKANLHYKKFRKGSTVELVHVWDDDTKIRGKTADELVFDEYQNFDADFLDVIEEVLSASLWRITIKTGTSLHTDTALNYSFEKSSMGYWHIWCPSCGHENIPLVEEGVIQMIQPKGPCCVKCGHLLNPEHGMYVHHQPEMLNRMDPKIGIHAAQLFTPAVIDNPARWRAMYHKLNSSGNLDAFIHENIGLPTEMGLRELTESHLKAICKEDDGTERKSKNYYFNLATQRKTYRWIVSGCDWGGSDHNRAERRKVSTTVHAILGVRPQGKCEILHFNRFTDMDYAGIADSIATTHKEHRGFALASDFGVGFYYNTKLREYIDARRHLVFQYVGPRSPHIHRPDATEMVNHYTINKTEMISNLFAAVKSRRILCYRYEEAQAYLNDFLQIYRNVKESDNGPTVFTFGSNPSKPNDAAQAVNYAFILARILLGEPLFDDPAVQREFEAIFSGKSALSGSASGVYSG